MIYLRWPTACGRGNSGNAFQTAAAALVLCLSDGAVIQMLGEQVQNREAGQLYNDAAVCNSRVVHGGTELKLRYCGFDTSDPSRDIFTGGLPGDGQGVGCDTGNGRRPIATGTLGTIGRGCRRASPTPVCSQRVNATTISTACQTQLLVVDTSESTATLEWTVFPQDRPCTGGGGQGISCAEVQTPTPSNPERRSFPYLPGVYQLQFGTSGDDCHWGSYNRADPPVFEQNASIPVTSGPCVRTLNVTDTLPPNITLRGPTVFHLDGGEVFIDPGVSGVDLADGLMIYNPSDVCTLLPDPTSTSGCRFFGTPGAICRFVDGGALPSNNCTGGLSFDSRRVGLQRMFYVARDGTGNINAVIRDIIVSDRDSPSLNLVALNVTDGLISNPSGTANVLANFSSDPFKYVDAGATSHDAVDGTLSFREITNRIRPGESQRIQLTDLTMAFESVRNQFNRTIRRHNPVREYPSHVSSTGQLGYLDGRLLQYQRVQRLFTVRYRVQDEVGNAMPNATIGGCVNPPNDRTVFACGVPREVEIVDATPPVLSLMPNTSAIVLEGGEHYYEPFLSAFDNLEGEISHKITMAVEVTDASATARRGTCQNCYIPIFDSNCSAVVPEAARHFCETGDACLPCGASNNALGSPQVRACIRPQACVPFGGEMNRIASTVPTGMRWTIRYTAFDSSGNRGDETRNVIVLDTTPPQLRLVGAEVVTVEGGEAYEPPLHGDPGVVATDNVDDDYYFTLMNKITIELEDVNMSQAIAAAQLTNFSDIISGTPFLRYEAFSTFLISYTARDNANLPSEKVYRLIQIQDSKAPFLNISLLPSLLEAGHPWSPNPTASDALDGTFNFFPRYSSRIREHVQRVELLCPSGSFRRKRCALCDETCVEASQCSSDSQFETSPVSPTTDRVCLNLTDCGSNPIQSPATATTDRTCEICSGTSGRYGVLNATATPPLIPYAFTGRVSGCNQISISSLLAAIRETKVAIYDFSPRTFDQASSTVPVGTLQSRSSSVNNGQWTNISFPVDRSQGFVLAADSAGHQIGLRFSPTPGFNGTVIFLAAVYSGSEESGQIALSTFSSRSVLTRTFQTVVPPIRVPPALSAALESRRFAVVDEDPFDDPTGKSIFMYSVNDIVCPNASSCYYSDMLGRTGGVVIVAADDRNGMWDARCCPRTFTENSDGCPQSQPFERINLNHSGLGLGLARVHCEIRFVPRDNFNTEVNDVTHAVRPLSERPYITLRAWAGRSGTAQENGQYWAPQLLNVTSELTLGGNSAVGVTAVDVSVEVRNVVDVPFLNITSALITFNDGDTHVSLTETNRGTLALVDPDAQGTQSLNISIHFHGDTVVFTLPPGITVTPISARGECSSSCIFHADTELPTIQSTSAFNALLQTMRYQPIGRNFSRPIANRTVGLGVNDGQGLTTITAQFRNVNRRPTLVIPPGADASNDQQPLQRIVLFDDDQVTTEALITILGGGNSSTFTYLTSPHFNVSVVSQESAMLYHVTATSRLTEEWERYIRSFSYSGQYPQDVRVSVRDAVRESLPILVLYTRSTEYTSPIIDLNGHATPGLDTDPAATSLFMDSEATVLLTRPYIFVFANSSVERADLSIVNAIDCPAEQLFVPNTSALQELGIQSFRRDEKSIMLIGRQSPAHYAQALLLVRYSNNATSPTADLRIISVTIHDDNSASRPAYATVSVRGVSNTSPQVFTRDGLSLINVPPHGSVVNNGVSVADLTSAPEHGVPRRPARYSVHSCSGGCSQDAAVDLCRRAASTLCSAEQLSRAFIQGDLPFLAWVSDTVIGTESDIHRVTVAQTGNSSLLNAQAPSQPPHVTFGAVAQALSGSKVPRTFPGLSTDRIVGRPVSAACCNPIPTSGQLRAQVEVQLSTLVSGTITFEQTSRLHATIVSLNLRVSRGSVATGVQPFFASGCSYALRIHSLPLNRSCSNVGSLFAAANNFSVNFSSSRAIQDPRVRPQFDIIGFSAISNDISLFGRNSIIGRSVVVTKERCLSPALAIGCGTISHMAEVRRMTASFTSPALTGTVSFVQAVDDLLTDTTITVSVSAPSALSAPLDWFLLQGQDNCLGLPPSSAITHDLRYELGAILAAPTFQAVYTVQDIDLSEFILMNGTTLYFKRSRTTEDVSRDVCAPVLSDDRASVIVTLGNNMSEYTIRLTEVTPGGSVHVDTGSDSAFIRIIATPPQQDQYGTRASTAIGNPCEDSVSTIATLAGRSGILTSSEGTGVSFFGASGIISRGIVVNVSGNVVCGTIPYPLGSVRATAQLFGPIVVGTVLIQELPGVLGSTTAIVDLALMPPSNLSQSPHPLNSSIRECTVSILPGTMPCGCTGSNAGDRRCTIAQLLPQDSIPVEDNRDLTTSITRSFVSDVQIRISGENSAIGSTLFIQDSHGIPLGHGTLRALIPKRVSASFGESYGGPVGNITVEQEGPWADATVSVDMTADESLGEWFISHFPPSVGTNGLTGASAYQCSQFAIVFDPPTPASVRSQRGNRGAGYLSGQLGDIACGTAAEPSAWRCEIAANGSVLPTRHRQYKDVGLSLYGRSSVLGRGLILTQTDSGAAASCTAFDNDAGLGNASFRYAATFPSTGSISGEVQLVETVGQTLIETTVYANISAPDSDSLVLRYTGSQERVCITAIGLLGCIDRNGQPLIRNPNDTIRIPLVQSNGLVSDSVRLQVYPSERPADVLTTVTLDTTCRSGTELSTGSVASSSGLLAVHVTPCRNWYIARSRSDGSCSTGPYNPFRAPLLPAVHPNPSPLQMPLGDLAAKLGKLRVPGVSVFSELSRYMLRENLDIVIGGGRDDASLSCRHLVRRHRSAASDSDEHDDSALGIALTGVSMVSGSTLQVKHHQNSTWTDISGNGLSRRTAVALGADVGSRIRVLAPPNFQGAITCLSCPDRVQTNGTCIPCALNRTMATVDFAAWDHSDGAQSGSRVDSTFITGGAYSSAIKKVVFEVKPEDVDELAPNGTAFDVTFSVRDNSGNLNSTVHRVHVVDTSAPIVALRGNATIYIEGGLPYDEPGVTAIDDRDLDYPVTTAHVVRIERRDTQRCTNPGVNACVEACVYEQVLTQFQDVPNQQLNVSDSIGTQYRLTYEVSDRSGHTANVSRVLQIVDQTAPIILPPTSLTYAVTQLEYTRGMRFQAVNVTASCFTQRSHYNGNESGLLGCFSAIDSVEGDLTCRTNVTVLKLPPEGSWGASNPAFSAAFILNDTCIARRSLSSTALDVNCYPGGMMERRGPVRSHSANTLAFSIITSGGPRPGNAGDASQAWSSLGTRYLLLFSNADAQGNRAVSSRMIVVADTTAPTMTCGGAECANIPVIAPFGSTSSQLMARLLSDTLIFDEESAFISLRGAEAMQEVFLVNNSARRLLSVSLDGIMTLVPRAYYGHYTLVDRSGNQVVLRRQVIVANCSLADIDGFSVTAEYTFANMSIEDFSVQNFLDIRAGIMSQFQSLKASMGNNDISYLDPPRCDRIVVAPFGQSGSGVVTVVVSVLVACRDALLAERSFTSFLPMLTSQVRLPVLTNSRTGIRATLVADATRSQQVRESCYSADPVDPTGALQHFLRSLQPPSLSPTRSPMSRFPDTSTSSQGPSSGNGWVVVILAPVLAAFLIFGIIAWRVKHYRQRQGRLDLLRTLSSDDVYVGGFAIPMEQKVTLVPPPTQNRRRTRLKSVNNLKLDMKSLVNAKPVRHRLEEDGPPLPMKRRDSHDQSTAPQLVGNGVRIATHGLSNDGPPLPRKRSESSSDSFSATCDDVYDGGATLKRGFGTDQKPHEPAPPLAPKQPPMEFRETGDDIYDGGATLKRGFGTDQKPHELAPTTRDARVVLATGFHGTEEDIYDGGVELKSGFDTNQREKSSAAREHSQIHTKAGQFYETKDDIYDGGSTFRKGFTVHQEEDAIAPPLPAKAPDNKH